jgi:hypothetical protein
LALLFFCRNNATSTPPAIAQQQNKAITKHQIQIRRNEPQDPDASEAKEFSAPELDRSLSREFNDLPDDPPDDDTTELANEAELLI